MGKVRDAFTKGVIGVVAVSTIASAGATVKYISENIEIKSRLDKIKEQKTEIVESVIKTNEYEQFIRRNISEVEIAHLNGKISDKIYGEEIKTFQSDDPETMERTVEMYLNQKQGYDNKMNKLYEEETAVSKEDDINKTIMACFGGGVVAGVYLERKLLSSLSEKENDDEDLVE